VTLCLSWHWQLPQAGWAQEQWFPLTAQQVLCGPFFQSMVIPLAEHQSNDFPRKEAPKNHLALVDHQ
jgi:hypothetical protein